jgi:hypothetical protein
MGQAMKNTPKKNKAVDQVVFRETLSQTMPLVPAANLPSNILTPYQFRSMVIAVWALAAIALGVGFGLLITPKPNVAVINPPDVQTSELSFVTPNNATVIPAGPISATLAGTEPAIGVTQAQAGNPVQTVSGNYLQPTAVPTAYTAGYSAYEHLQGAVGTSPVK